MKLGELLNPWAAIREARGEAERLRALLIQHRNEIRQVSRELSFAIFDRDTARLAAIEAGPLLEELAAIKRRRSEAISRGNRTRGRRRRGGLLPAPINDIADAPAPNLRTELTG